ncbi:putative leucine-rich repeat-containing protein DDB_G0290503 isoform X2 [Colletes gigas]|uniref:putative leucine-rich repeat-containing protein DDB_G0290503 isoform X2 n=1 Tax=Colletes gigas TaxID=935657 RepID=UPI001C9A5F29|nr:putative leucine-rich repeat-containing protein DDB_G0290503 isoform X2 [Colletes gigas]
MDLQTGLVCIAVVVISAVVIVLVSMFGIKEKSYEEAIAEQRKLPDDLLLSKKDKGKEKKHKNKAGKKVKEKKEEKDEKDDKEEKSEHVQFEENPKILPLEPLTREGSKGSKKKSKFEKLKPILVNKDEPLVIVTDLSPSQPPLVEANHFDLIQPKDDLELIRSHSKENLHQISQSEPVANKSPKETPTKAKKNAKDSVKKKDENSKEEKKDEKKETTASINTTSVINKDAVKETKDIKEQKESVVKDVKEIVKEIAPSTQLPNKESKKTKKKNDILAQIGGDRDAVNVSLLMPLVQKAELSRSEIQILIDQLLNKQMDNPSEHSEWTEGRADPVIKLKKQLAEKEKAFADEHEANIAFQNKLKELRAELNSERSRLSASVRQLEEALNTKVTETQTLHTRMQHILESHAAEKQGFTRQIEQLQAKVNENAAIIHKMQDQGQTQGHLQQELIAQRKQMEVQFAQMRENENALKAQLAQKQLEVQESQNELQETCESSAAEIEMSRRQLEHMQEQFMRADVQLQHFKDTVQDVARQLDESHRANADLDHRLQNAHRREQDLQKQVNSLQTELNTVQAEANDVSTLKGELNKAQSELVILKSELSVSMNETQSEAAEIATLKVTLANKEEELIKSQDELNNIKIELKQSMENATQFEAYLNIAQEKADMTKAEFEKATESLKKVQGEVNGYQSDMQKLKEELKQTQTELENTRAKLTPANETANEMKMLKVEMNKLQNNEMKLNETQLQITRLQEENDRLSTQLVNFIEFQKQLKQLQEENESLASQLTAIAERPAAEGRENGIDDNIQKKETLLVQKENQLDALKTELTHKEAELKQLNAQVDALRSDLNSHRSLAARLSDDLEAQRSKNNEIIQKIKIEQEELTKAFLQRIFPEIKVSEKSHDQWLRLFEEKVSTVLSELKKKNVIDKHSELEKQNKSLQDMVSHYKQIIDDTETMLNKLQSHVESEEARWESQLRQKENEVANLRIELSELMNKLNANEMVQVKLVELESRLKEAESFKEQADAEYWSSGVLENLKKDKAQLSEELQSECNKRTTLDAEVIKLRSLVAQHQQEVSQLKNEVSEGCSSSEQSILNGPPTSECPNSEPPLAAQTLIAALENTLLKNTEFANCSVTKPINLVQSQQEIDNSPLSTKYSSKSCHMTDHNTQASWNPLMGQQHKKYKKKRKVNSKIMKEETNIIGSITI